MIHRINIFCDFSIMIGGEIILNNEHTLKYLLIIINSLKRSRNARYTLKESTKNMSDINEELLCVSWKDFRQNFEESLRH